MAYAWLPNVPRDFQGRYQILTHWSLNDATDIRQWTEFDTESLHEPVMTQCQIYTKGHTSVRLVLTYKKIAQCWICLDWNEFTSICVHLTTLLYCVFNMQWKRDSGLGPLCHQWQNYRVSYRHHAVTTFGKGREAGNSLISLFHVGSSPQWSCCVNQCGSHNRCLSNTKPA